MKSSLETEAPSAPPTIRQFVTGWLSRHCAAVQGTQRGAVLLSGTKGLQLVASQPAGASVPAWINEAAAGAIAARGATLIERQGEDGQPLRVIAHPLVVSNMFIGAAVLAVDAAHPLGEPEYATLAASAASFNPTATSVEAATPSSGHLQQVFEALSKVGACKSLSEAAAALSTRLAGDLDCERVNIGLRRGRLTRLTGSSDHWDSEPTSLVSDVLAAMDEAIDDAGSVIYPVPEGKNGSLVVAHSLLSNKLASRGLCTVPLVAGGEVIGAILAERRPSLPFAAADQAWLESVANAVAPWFAQQRRLELPLHERVRSAVRQWLSEHGKGRYRLAAALGIPLLLAFLCWPAEHDISSPVKLEGAVQRIVTSPGDNYLQKVYVRPGDVVKAGQVLLEFSTEDLRVERQRLQAEIGGHDAAVGDAMGKQDLSALALENAKINEGKAQLALLDQRLSKARIVAPFDAVVIQGDLSNALGAPTKKGDALMTLAPANDFRAIVEIDDSDISQVREGQLGRMVLTALPDATLPVRVKRITPLQTVGQGRSYFEVEVELLPHPDMDRQLRPGMRGIARLQAEPRARIVSWIDQAVTWTRLAWWRFVG